MAHNRATRLAKDWYHVDLGPVLVNGASTSATDILINYRTAFGQQKGTLTLMRTLLYAQAWDLAQGTAGKFAFGLIKGSIGLAPNARPLGVGADDFTDWLYFWGAGLSATASVENTHPDDRADLRGMRKFDASRETLWMLLQTTGGTTAWMKFNWSLRLLFGS